MKLDDIDILNSWRKTYKDRRDELSAVVRYTPQTVQFNNSYIKDQEIMRAVKEVVQPMIQKKLDEAKAKLMMLGITEFPE